MRRGQKSGPGVPYDQNLTNFCYPWYTCKCIKSQGKLHLTTQNNTYPNISLIIFDKYGHFLLKIVYMYAENKQCESKVRLLVITSTVLEKRLNLGSWHSLCDPGTLLDPPDVGLLGTLSHPYFICLVIGVSLGPYLCHIFRWWVQN